MVCWGDLFLSPFLCTRWDPWQLHSTEDCVDRRPVFVVVVRCSENHLPWWCPSAASQVLQQWTADRELQSLTRLSTIKLPCSSLLMYCSHHQWGWVIYFSVGAELPAAYTLQLVCVWPSLHNCFPGLSHLLGLWEINFKIPDSWLFLFSLPQGSSI